VHVRQQKTGRELAIPIHAALAAIIAETPANHLNLLTSKPASRSVRRDLVIGFVIVATRLAYPIAQHMDCARPLLAVSLRQDAPCTKLPRSRARQLERSTTVHEGG